MIVLIIISEWLLNDEKTGPVPSSLMSLTMIIEQPQGRNYSYEEVSKMLIDVGFKNIERRPLSWPGRDRYRIQKEFTKMIIGDV